MQVYNCLVVDDEPPAREVLKRYIQKMPMLHLAGECGNALQVMPFLYSQPVDIIFLDIQMPQLSGLELVSTLTNSPKIILPRPLANMPCRVMSLMLPTICSSPSSLSVLLKRLIKRYPL